MEAGNPAIRVFRYRIGPLTFWYQQFIAPNTPLLTGRLALER